MMFLNFGKKRTVDHFIPGDGVSAQWFEENFARYIGPDTEWTYCTHMENGKEGFLCKVYEPISPDAILRMRLDYHETKQRSKNKAKRAYLARLEDTWRREEREEHHSEGARQQYQARAQQQENWQNNGGPGQNTPILQFSPSHNSAQNNSSRDDRTRSKLVWNVEKCCWDYEQGYPTNNTRYTRSTPVTPISPTQGGYWGNKLDSGVSLSPVSPLSDHGSSLGYQDQCQQRTPGILAHQDWSTGIKRPCSAADMRQLSTGQILFNISRGSYSWI